MSETPSTLKFTRRNLPHWLVADRSYFVTLRLHGSLPKVVTRQLRDERESLIARKPAPTQNELTDLQRKHFLRIESILDCASSENNWLANSDVAELIMGNLSWLHDKRGWRIYAACVMSNHLHILMRNEKGRSENLLDDLAHFKRFSAQKANALLDRTGAFWTREDFDHWIRTPDKFESTVRYIVENPVKAGLVENWQEWRWSFLDDAVKELVK